LDPFPDYRTSARAVQQNLVLTRITPGAANETGTLTVSASASALFTPTVSYTNGLTTAVLSFTPGNSAGSSVVTVTVNDGGGSNNIVTRTFTVFVRASGAIQPGLSTVPNITTAKDTPTPPIPFTIGSGVTAVTNLSLRVQSSNLLLVPNTNIVFGGSGSNRNLIITPA